MCSRGSVIPLFIDQIKNNRPITITDQEILVRVSKWCGSGQTLVAAKHKKKR